MAMKLPVPGERVSWNEYLSTYSADRELLPSLETKPEVEGIVIPRDDPDFWNRVSGFDSYPPTPEDVQARLNKHKEKDWLQDCVIVQFDTGRTCFVPVAELRRIVDGKMVGSRRKPPAIKPKTGRPKPADKNRRSNEVVGLHNDAPRISKEWGGAVEL